MISSQKCNSVFVHDFQNQNIQESFYAVESSVDIISHE